jgi:hypothetical protein
MHISVVPAACANVASNQATAEICNDYLTETITRFREPLLALESPEDLREDVIPASPRNFAAHPKTIERTPCCPRCLLVAEVVIR